MWQTCCVDGYREGDHQILLIWWWLTLEISWKWASNAQNRLQWRENRDGRERVKCLGEKWKCGRKPLSSTRSSWSRAVPQLNPTRMFITPRDRMCHFIAIAKGGQIPSRDWNLLSSRSHMQITRDCDQNPNIIQNFITPILAISRMKPSRSRILFESASKIFPSWYETQHSRLECPRILRVLQSSPPR